MNEKWVKGGDLSWHLPLGHYYSDTILARPGPARAGDPDKS